MISGKNRIYGKTKLFTHEQLKELFQDKRFEFIIVALLFGSRAVGSYHDRSDYDFAFFMDKSYNTGWGIKAEAWVAVEEVLGLDDCDFDIVDLEKADEVIKHSIKEGYIILKGDKDEASRILS